MSFGRSHLTNIWRRARRFGAAPAAVAALLFGAVRCADLTAPAAVGNITIVYADPAYPSTQITQPVTGKRVDYAVGLELSPKFDVMIGSSIQPRARYVYSRASADSGRVAISQNGNAVRVIRPGIDTVIATVVGATIGGPTNGVKLADTILVFASADSLFVEKRNVTFTAITAVDTLDAAALATDNTAIPGVPIQWTSLDPAVVSVTQLGSGESAILQAQSNGTAVVRVQFAGFAAINVNVTVQQTFKRYFLSPPATAFTSKTATASVTAVAQDSLNQTFVAGTPPTFQYVSSAPGKVSIDPATGLMRAVDNTAGTDVEITGQISGVVMSNTVTAAVAQDATTIDIQSQDPRTISSIGATLSLGVIVRDALNQDWTKEEVLWTVSNSGKATATQFGLTTVVTAQDTGQVYVRAKADNAIDSILVIITNDPATVELSPDPFALTSLNQTGTLAAIVKNAAGTTLTSGFTLTWVSRDSNIVEPQPTGGQMLARNTGEARIVVTTNNNVSDSLTVRVTNAPDTVRIVPDTIFLTNVGDVNSTFAVDFKNGLGATLPKSSVAWTTANVNVADVAVGTGAISAIGSGTTYVLAVSPENPLRRDSVYVVVTNNSASMNVTPGTTQTLTALGATLDFDATVFNSAGNPISGATVTWSVPVGGAFVSVNAVTGVATALANGSATVRATSGGVTRDVTVNVAQAFSATQSSITPAAPSIVADGTSNTTINVQLRDANANNLTFGASTVVLSTSLGTLSTVNDAGNGLYTATLTSSTSAGTAIINGTANAAAISTSGVVAFTAGGAAKYLVTSTSTTPVAGTSVTIRAQLADQNNNPVASSNSSVTFTSTNGGTFTGANPALTDGTGVAQITFNTSNTVASHTITAATGSLSGASAAITSIAGAPTKYLVTPTTATNAAVASGVLITAQLSDANDNAVALPNQTVNWSLSAANGSFSGSPTASTTTNASGIASVLYTTSNTASVATQVRANFGSAPTGTSATITTVAGSSGLITIEQSPTANPQSGVIFGTQPTIQLRDAQGNPVSQANVSVTAALTSGTGTLTAPPAQTNGSGLATFAGMRIDGPTGPKTITFSVSGVGTVDAGVTLAAGSETQIAANSTTSQSATVGTLATPPSVIVRDANNNPVANVSVRFDVTAAATGGAITVPGTGGSILTDAFGVATVGTWTLGSAAGTNNNVVTATAAGLSGSPVTFTASGNAGTVANFLIAPVGAQVAGTPFNITITARDGSGNTATSFSGAGNTADVISSGTLSAGGGTTATFTNGVLVHSVTISNTGNFTLTVTRTSGTENGSSNSFSVASGAASLATSTIVADAPAITADQTSAITVTLRDANSNPLTASGGTVALSTSIGMLSGVTNNSNGTYTATFTATTVGTATISGTLNGAPIADGEAITITPGVASAVTTTITANPTSVAADGAATSTITVQAKDADGNNLTTEADAVTLTAAPGGALVVAAGPAGSGTYTATLPGSLTAGNVTITGTITTVGITDNAIVTRTPLAGANYLVTPSSLTPVAGTNVMVTAQLRDINNNPVAQSGRTVSWSATNGGSFAVPTSLTNASGQASNTFTVSTNAAVNHVVTALDETSIFGSSAAIDVTPGSISVGASGTQLSGINLTRIADGAEQATITLQLRDQFGNAITTSGVDVTFATTLGTLSATTTTTGAGGTVSVTLTSVGAGSANVTATVDHDANGGTAQVAVTNGSPVTVTFNAGGISVGASGTELSGMNLTRVADGAEQATITLQLRDQFGNPITTSGVDVTFATTRGTLSATTTTTGAGGNVSVTLTSTSSGPADVTATVDHDASGGTAQLAVTNGSPVTVTFNPGGISVGASGTQLSGVDLTRVADGVEQATITLQLRDQFGNPITTTGVGVTFATTRGALSATTTATGAGGNVSVTLTSTESGPANVTATVDDDNDGGTTAEVAVTNGSPVAVTFNPGNISVGASGTQLSGANLTRVADGVEQATITLQLRDQFGNAITTSGVEVTFATTLGTLSATTTTTGAGGTVSVTLTSTTSGTANVTATVDDDNDGGTTAEVAVTNGSPVVVTFQDGDHLTITTQPAGAADGVDFTQQPVIEVRSATNAVITGYVGSMTAIVESVGAGACALSGTTTIPVASGVAAFTDLRCTGTATDVVLRFTATGTFATQAFVLSTPPFNVP